MQREVYADLLFLINFSMDFLSLYLSTRFLHRQVKPVPMCLAAIIGGLYSVCSIFLSLKKILLLSLDILICLLMCTIVFYSKETKIKKLLSATAFFVLISSILGGIMTVLFNQLNRFNLPLKNGGDNISVWLFLLLAAISAITTFNGGNFFKKASTQKIVNAEITLNGNSITLSGITDTGNILHDPASGKPVIITDINATLTILPDIIIESILSGNIELISDIPKQYVNKIRIIPCSSISGNKLILGIVPDKVVIHNKNGANDVSALFAPLNIPSLPKNCEAIIPGELNF